MNKLGFYIENSTVPFLREALREVRPPTILIHAGDRGLLREIRRDLSPDSFVIGRLFVPLSDQEASLQDSDPEGRGRSLADYILSYDMGLAQERGANGRLLVDAWMALNEALRGPASFPDGRPDAETLRRADALDRLQVAFRERLAERDVEAVAFNFGAGNFTQPAHFTELFPRTLRSYIYLGFHEYGWPTLVPRAATATAALLYRRCMEGIRQRFGGRHRAIITEAGLARMYKHAHDPAGDVGWLYPGEPIPEEQYWESLRWYNGELLKDGYVLGACLFSVGHSGRWESFRLLGNDNAGRPILLMSRIASLGASALAPAPTPAPAPAPEPDKPAPPAPKPLDPTLRKRLAFAEEYLKLTVQQTKRLEALHAEMAASLTSIEEALPPPVDPIEIEILQQQIEHLMALVARYAAESGAIAYPPDLEILRWRIIRLRERAAAMSREVAAVEGVRADFSALTAELQALESGFEVIPALRRRAERMLAEAASLRVRLGSTRDAPFTDLCAELPASRSKQFVERDESDIRWIIVHHTASEVGPERLARAAIRKGLPGLPYHFFIAADGTVYQTQDEKALIEQIGLQGVDATSIAVGLAGQFDAATPSEAQLDGLADLIIWLLARYGLTPDAIVGASEVSFTGTSPGIQWLQGSQYKLVLLERLPGRFSDPLSGAQHV
jgi:hypothetical protein